MLSGFELLSSLGAPAKSEAYNFLSKYFSHLLKSIMLPVSLEAWEALQPYHSKN